MANETRRRVLIVDLNNFAHYPTLAVGLMVATLRNRGYETRLLSPLAFRLPTMPERRETWWDHLQRRVYFSTHPATVGLRDRLATARRQWVTRPDPRITEEASLAVDEFRPDIILLSAYLDFYQAVSEISRIAGIRGIPVLVGGPAFNMDEVAAHWSGIPGLTAIVAAEVDSSIGGLVDAVLRGDDLSVLPGVYLPDGRRGAVAAPLSDLTDVPVPDFTDFPWHFYPNRIIPVMTGRGCNWGQCTFCSDVKVVNGLSFRSRSVTAVLDELQRQSARHQTKDVIFLDIKLNSNVAMWRGIIENFQEVLPGGRWIGTVHVQASGENGLTHDELHAAARSGLTRLSFGLETGSQRVNDAMAKGTRIDRTSAFLKHARSAGISVRATSILGYPGETADDVLQTVAFLEAHQECLDRIRLNRFSLLPNTRFHELLSRNPARFPGLANVKWDYRLRRGEYRYTTAYRADYRKAKTQLLKVVHRINSRPLRPIAEVFDGLM